MGRQSGSIIENKPAATVAGTSLTREQLVEFYRLMYLSRRTDDREIVLKRQQKIYFQISCAGHEALLVAAGMALRPGYDWFFPYYRDRAICLALGNTVEEQLLQAVGAADDPASGGRQMPSHWSSTKLHIVSPSSSTATQCLHAIGCAEAGRYFTNHPQAAVKFDGDYRQFKDVTFQHDEVVYVSIGEGSTSQGEFWESLNTASNGKLPVLYVVSYLALVDPVPNWSSDGPSPNYRLGGWTAAWLAIRRAPDLRPDVATTFFYANVCGLTLNVFLILAFERGKNALFGFFVVLSGLIEIGTGIDTARGATMLARPRPPRDQA